MKKLESLKKLVEVIEKQEVLANGDYCRDGVNCVVGHLLKLDGITNEQLRELDNGRYSDHGADDYAINSILEAIIESNLEEDFVKKSLENLGFNLKEDKDFLNELQLDNDARGKQAVIDRLNITISQMELMNRE